MSPVEAIQVEEGPECHAYHTKLLTKASAGSG